MSTLAIKPKNDTDTVEFQTHSGNTAIKVQGTELNLYNLASDTDLSSIHKYGNKYAFTYNQHTGDIISGGSDTQKVFGNTMSGYSKDHFTTIYDKAPTGYGIVTDDVAVKYKAPKTGLYHTNIFFSIQNDGTGGPGGNPSDCRYQPYLFSGNFNNEYSTNNSEAWNFSTGYISQTNGDVRWHFRHSFSFYMTENTIYGWSVHNTGASSRWKLNHFSGYFISEVTI